MNAHNRFWYGVGYLMGVLVGLVILLVILAVLSGCVLLVMRSF